jgi:hypothetical protein
MPEVPRERTPIAMPAAAVELEFALRGAAVPDLHQDMCALLLAQIAFETGSGRSCDNRNIGNITTSDKTRRDFFRPIWFTVDGDPDPGSPWATNRAKLLALHEAMLKGQAPRAFVSYKSFFDGFDDYVRELRVQFPTIIDAARTGDAQATADAIKSSHYTPDAPPTLGATLDSLRKRFLAEGLFSSLPKEQPAPFEPVPAVSSWLDS